MPGCQELSKVYNYPNCAIRFSKQKDESFIKFKSSIETVQKQKFPKGLIFPTEQDNTYPIEYNGISFDMMKLKIIYDREKTGYEEEK